MGQTGGVTEELRAAAADYQQRWQAELFAGDPSPDIVCNHLTEPLGEFMGDQRKSFCTNLVATVAALVAEVAIRHGASVKVHPVRH